MEPGRALVTGAGARLGKAMALALGKAGWQVAVHYRSSSAGADETADRIRAAGGTAETVQADLSREADTAGPLTLLVNSASTFEPDSARDHDRTAWDHHFEANLRAPVHLAQGFAGQVPEDTHALIVNMIDQRVLKLNPQFFTYTLSKSALWTATRTMAQTFAPNIRVNGIGPGPTLPSTHQTEEEFEQEKAHTLTGEGTNPDEIVRALFFLIEAQSVTGQMIASDGGQHLLWQTPDLTD